MKTSFSKLTLLLCFLFLIMACQDDDDIMVPADCLPPATQTGENTFGCLINGNPWVAEIDPGVFDPTLRPLDMVYDETDTGVFYNNSMTLRSKQVADSIFDAFTLSASFITEESSLNVVNNNIRATYRSSYSQLFTNYEIDTLLPVKLDITKLDTLRNICSGTFEFYALSNDKTDTLHITEGRFDKKYSPE